jgi:hypothetical protein
MIGFFKMLTCFGFFFSSFNSKESKQDWMVFTI